MTMCQEEFTHAQTRSIWITACSLASISILSSGSIIYSYIRFADLRKFSFELVVMLVISDVFANVTYFMGNELHGGACTFQGWMQQFFELASILWSCVIGLTLWSSVVRQTRVFATRMKLHIAVWGISAFVSFLPFSTNSYGESGSWCWIKGDEAGTYWRYAAFYVLLWIIFFCNVYCYNVVRKTINGFVKVSAATTQQVKLKKLAEQLKWYPLILVFAWTLPTISRIQQTLDPHCDVFWLTILHTIFRGTQGILNALAYGMTSTVRENWDSLRHEIRSQGCSVICSSTPVRTDDVGSINSPTSQQDNAL